MPKRSWPPAKVRTFKREPSTRLADSGCAVSRRSGITAAVRSSPQGGRRRAEVQDLRELHAGAAILAKTERQKRKRMDAARKLAVTLIWPPPSARGTIQVKAGRLIHCLCYGAALALLIYLAVGINEGVLALSSVPRALDGMFAFAVFGRAVRYLLARE